jgi:probable phosphoglycerate mutase
VSLTLYFLRHGETVYSQTGGYCGELDPELTEEGGLMAKQFAEAYHTLPWTAVYVSPMQRTMATAKPLCEAVGIEMQRRDGLKEIRYGKSLNVGWAVLGTPLEASNSVDRHCPPYINNAC